MTTLTREDLKPAVKRFNRWQFAEAADMFRELAQQSSTNDKSCLLAMADIAAAFDKIWHKGGQPYAMVSSLTQGVAELGRHGTEFIGLALGDFVPPMANCLQEAKRWRRGDTEIFNRDLIPRLEFAKS